MEWRSRNLVCHLKNYGKLGKELETGFAQNMLQGIEREERKDIVMQKEINYKYSCLYI